MSDINWFYWIKCKLGFHDWSTIDVSFYDSHLKCEKCYKQKIVPHSSKEFRGWNDNEQNETHGGNK